MLCPKCGKETWKGYGDSRWSPGEGLICLSCGWKKDEYVPSPDKKIVFHKDIEYYTEYPAPLHENMQRMHFANINSTTPYFSHMLYYFARQACACEKILEIGTAEGYTSFFLAHAVRDSAVRFNMTGNHFYGVDIVQTERVQEQLRNEGLPATIINMDSMTLTSETFKDTIFDLIYQDGAHDEEHVVYEFRTMWSQLKDNGNGYWVSHDAEGPAWHGCRTIRKILREENIPHEVFNIGGQYGLMLVRNMKNFNYEKDPWS